MDLDMADHVVAQQSWVADMHDPDRTLISMAPPKRFYRRNWQSFSLLLLNRSLLLVASYRIAARRQRRHPNQTRQTSSWLDQGCLDQHGISSFHPFG
jgi:hypothetical protein